MRPPMAGRGFLDVARDVVAGPTEFHRRAAIIHAYYALILECRDVLLRWGLGMPPRANMHSWVRLRFAYSSHPEIKTIGDLLDKLVQRRNQASYDLRATTFPSLSLARQSIADAATGITLLDQI